MSKFLLNLLLQISKALIYSKIKFFIRKRIFPSLSAQSAQRPAGPSGLSPQPPPTSPLSRVSPPASQPSGLWPAHPAFPSPPSLTCGPRPVIFFPRPTAAAAVSCARTPPPGVASAPVTTGAPTPHHSPPHNPADSLPIQPPSFHYGAPPLPPIPL
jgi:hypothetical protein